MLPASGDFVSSVIIFFWYEHMTVALQSSISVTRSRQCLRISSIATCFLPRAHRCEVHSHRVKGDKQLAFLLLYVQYFAIRERAVGGGVNTLYIQSFLSQWVTPLNGSYSISDFISQAITIILSVSHSNIHSPLNS